MVVYGDLEQRTSCHVANCPAVAPKEPAPFPEGHAPSGEEPAGILWVLMQHHMPSCILVLLAPQRPAWCWGSRTPAPLSCSPLWRSVPGATAPSGAILGQEGGRAVAGISPSLCSEHLRAKRINRERVRGNSPGAAADAVLSMLWQDFALLAHVLLLSLLVPSVNRLCPQCYHHPWCPQGCSPPCPAMPNAPFATLVPCSPMPTLPACLHP